MSLQADADDNKHCFVKLSAVLTGFSVHELYGTGRVDEYYAWVGREAQMGKLLECVPDMPEPVEASEQTEAEEFVQSHVLNKPGIGDVARALIKLWYLGQWEIWHEKKPAGETKIPSAEAYKEGLIWKVISSHPQAAKGQGFGAWAIAPDQALISPDSLSILGKGSR